MRATKVRADPRVALQPGRFNGVKVFSATMFADREKLGDRVSNWIAEHARVQVADMVVTQSSDASFHCIAITLFYFEPLGT